MGEDIIVIMIQGPFFVFFLVTVILSIRWHIRFDKTLKKTREIKEAETKGG